MQCSLPSGRKMHGAASLAPFAPLLVIYGGWKTGPPMLFPTFPFFRTWEKGQFGKIESICRLINIFHVHAVLFVLTLPK